MGRQIGIARFGLLMVTAATLMTSCRLGRFVFYNFAETIFTSLSKGY
jgi:hypothetical protein